MEEKKRTTPNVKRKLTTQILGASETGKLPPQATDIEEAVLGAMLLEKNAVNDAIDILQPESFYKPEHQKIFSMQIKCLMMLPGLANCRPRAARGEVAR